MAPYISSYTKQRIINLCETIPRYTDISKSILKEDGVVISRQTVAKVVKTYRRYGYVPRKEKSGRKKKMLIEHLNFIDLKMGENDEYSSVGMTILNVINSNFIAKNVDFTQSFNLKEAFRQSRFL